MALETFGEFVCRRRTELDMSQVEVSQELGMSQSTVSAWEMDQTVPRRQALRRLAEVLQVDPAGLAALVVVEGAVSSGTSSTAGAGDLVPSP